MEYLICCGCCLLCFLCGAWTARGKPKSADKKPTSHEPQWTAADDKLSHDIAAMLAYTPNKEDSTDADT